MSLQSFLRSPAIIGSVLILSMASNLRLAVGQYAVGPGEVVLLVLTVVALVSERHYSVLLKNPIVWFWGLLAVTMAIGLATGNLKGEWALRNSTAYVFTALITVGLASLLYRLSDQQLKQLLLWVAGLALLFLWFGFCVFIFGTEAATLFFGLTQMGGRYSGWSNNPNQLALLLIPLPVWIMASRFYARSFWSAANWITLYFTLTILMGAIVRSDALLLAWSVGFAVWGVLKLKWSGRKCIPVVFSIAVILGIALSVIKVFPGAETQKPVRCLLAKVFDHEAWRSNCEAATWSDGRATLAISSTYAERKKSIRFDLWQNGLAAWLKAPWFGHGPGAFASYSNKEDQVQLEQSGRSLEEAHSTVIDLLTQGGLLLALGWLGLQLWLLHRAWLIRDPYTVSVVITLAVFSLFHYHIRQPYLWFVLLFCYESVRRRLFVVST